MAFSNVVLPVEGTTSELSTLQHSVLGVKTLPSSGEQRRRHWRRTLFGGVVS
jgi:hypothetical protein